jgi:predicted dehydrogenase
MSKGPVKVAMIGLGWWGKKMTAVLKKANADIEIVCAAEPNPAGAEFAATNGFKHYANFKEALKHPGVEAVILATPHSFHAEQIKASVAAKKHIFCEKPLALTRKGAEYAVNACKKAMSAVGNRPLQSCWKWRAAAHSAASSRLKAISVTTSSRHSTSPTGV